jgi:ribonuclease PH
MNTLNKDIRIRPLVIETEINRYAEGSALIKAGNTHVICTATVENSVPSWLSGQGKGWISAEYSMLPRATHSRTKRDREKTSGRTQEIQRLIGRALRACIDLKKLGERSVLIDCDVLQADGGTRTASITGGCIALGIAMGKLISSGKVPIEVWKETVAAISLGIKNREVLVDLNYQEDSSCEVDMNFVITGSKQLIEVQGTAEQRSFSPEDLNKMTICALEATSLITELQKSILSKWISA